LDVVSLFTNVPLGLAIDGVSKRWTHITKNTKLPQKAFLEAVKFVLTSTYFTFNNSVTTDKPSVHQWDHLYPPLLLTLSCKTWKTTL